MRKFALLFLMLLLPVLLLSQEKRPKVGLVLSGGAAKGLAHIPLLKALDSLGIVPDYITGTSMGAIIGGLYASGYSGDSLERITTALPWEDLLDDQIPFMDISIEEKDEFGKYALELPLKGLQPQIPLGLVEGQRLEAVMKRLNYPVSHITDFNELPIPFNCVASDVAEGRPLVFKGGDLTTAMRASMAIPMFFTPVELDTLLLVDGMMFSNFPVSYCRDMGADFIIGCDVGGGIFTAEELTSMPMILYQAAILGSYADYQKQKADCDIFIDAYPLIKPSPLEFNRSEEIIAAGEQAVAEVLPRLAELAELYRFDPPPKRVTRERPERLTLNQLKTKGLSEPNRALSLGKFGLEPGDTLSFHSIEKGLADMYGTRLFNKVSYNLKPLNDSMADLTLHVKESYPAYGKFALHYDTERGAGLIVNYTIRNALGSGSRLVLRGDIAETPRALVSYYRFLDEDCRYWWNLQSYFEHQEQNQFIGTGALGKFKETYFNVESQLRRTLNRHTYAGLGIMFEHSRLEPNVNPEDLSAKGAREVRRYRFDRFSGVFQFERNTRNRVYYPSRGLLLFLESQGVFANTHEASYLITDPETGMSQIFDVDEDIRSYIRTQLRVQQNWKWGDDWSIYVRGELGFAFEVGPQDQGVSYFNNGLGSFFQLGGAWQRPRDWVVPFWGLREQELVVPNYAMTQLGFQWSPLKGLYAIPAINVLAAGNTDDWLDTLPELRFEKGPAPETWLRSGWGLSLAYHSVVGPIQFTYARTFETGQTRVFLNIGYTF